MSRRSARRRYYLVSLGCAKNTVDAQGMALLLEQAGYSPAASPQQADLLIVNTCGFIEPAREESLAVISELASGKQAIWLQCRYSTLNNRTFYTFLCIDI